MGVFFSKIAPRLVSNVFKTSLFLNRLHLTIYILEYYWAIIMLIFVLHTLQLPLQQDQFISCIVYNILFECLWNMWNELVCINYCIVLQAKRKIYDGFVSVNDFKIKRIRRERKTWICTNTKSLTGANRYMARFICDIAKLLIFNLICWRSPDTYIISTQTFKVSHLP